MQSFTFLCINVDTQSSSELRNVFFFGPPGIFQRNAGRTKKRASVEGNYRRHSVRKTDYVLLCQKIKVKIKSIVKPDLKHCTFGVSNIPHCRTFCVEVQFCMTHWVSQRTWQALPDIWPCMTYLGRLN